jgi:hypothetical protein
MIVIQYRLVKTPTVCHPGTAFAKLQRAGRADIVHLPLSEKPEPGPPRFEEVPALAYIKVDSVII